ncbi:Ovarian tumour, otubain [Ostreococcus tauri]|uniref:Ovarian tumour, otubain n=1 Tax=Ostreococcus tauri TaxID=70448 RepID=A0A090M3J7_OSTTA|nr:Ovarian tumour, otubain [Ostreococcus tauri]CEF96584.1 Ovarian tumour, otubain [Ostreococcus tauri]|eukprot:XP_022838174.1 Ovarian tumour, otubain [Ostreococcus tauri]
MPTTRGAKRAFAVFACARPRRGDDDDDDADGVDASARRLTRLLTKKSGERVVVVRADARAAWRRAGTGVRAAKRLAATSETSARVARALRERIELELEGESAREARERAGIQTLDGRLGRLGMRRIAMVGDGNCQFRALSHNLFKSQERHAEVRAAVVRDVEARREEFEIYFESSREFEKWLREMKRDRTWGDELTLRAACDSFGVKIHVIQSTEKGWNLMYEPFEVKSKRVAFISYVSPVHYDAIAER